MPACSPAHRHFAVRRRDWFTQRRDRFLRQLVDDFLRVYEDFVDLYTLALRAKLWEKAGPQAEPMAGDEPLWDELWERLRAMVGSETDRGILWHLKDRCHQVWPQEDQQADDNGTLVDWMMASLFHEAMKLKENIYMLKRYGPAIHQMRGQESGMREINGPGTLDPRLTRLVDLDQLFWRIRAEVPRQIDLLAQLFGQVCFLWRLMLPDLHANMLLLRLLIEREDQVTLVWGEKLEALVAAMFAGEAAAGFCAAGRSYQQGQWFEQAMAMYRRALTLDPDNDEARIKVVQLEALLGCRQPEAVPS